MLAFSTTKLPRDTVNTAETNLLNIHSSAIARVHQHTFIQDATLAGESGMMGCGCHLPSPELSETS